MLKNKPKGLLWWLSGKESTCSVGDAVSISGSGRSSGEGMATHSSIPAWEIPWTGSLAGCSPWGCQRVRLYLATENTE